MSLEANHFLRKPPNSKRSEPRRRTSVVRLYGEEKTELRRQAFERSGGFCECDELDCGSKHDYSQQRLCFARITWETMELSHKAHGPRKTDTLDGVLASCKECHQKVHNPKSVPRRAGKLMNIKEAREYWESETCFCNEPKKARESFCPECTLKVTPQIRHDLENADEPETYREALALAEIEILQWRAA